MSFWKIWNGKEKEGRESMPQTDQLHTTEQLLIIALFLSWTKCGLFLLLWSLDTAGRICTHVSLLWSYCSPCCSLLAGTLLASILDLHTVRMKSIKLFMFLLILWLYKETVMYCEQVLRTTVKLQSWLNRVDHAVGVYFCKTNNKTSFEVRFSNVFNLYNQCNVRALFLKYNKHLWQETTTIPTTPLKLCTVITEGVAQQTGKNTPHIAHTALLTPFLIHPYRKSTPRPFKQNWASGTTLVRPSTDPGDQRQAAGEEWSPMSRCCRPVHGNLTGWLQASTALIG